MSDYILIYITASSAGEAEKIARALVEQRLAACTNIVPDIRSVFWWNQTVETEQEVLLMCKSTAALFPAIIKAVKALHSYEVPEIIGMPIILGAEDYLSWISSETQASPA
jgi:periplasmic divalent cation tolerance protein